MIWDAERRGLLKGGKTCFATNGENQYHAVFTKGHRCVIVNPSTLAPVLIALGATAEVRNTTGTRTLELAKFFHAPNSATEREQLFHLRHSTALRSTRRSRRGSLSDMPLSIREK